MHVTKTCFCFSHVINISEFIWMLVDRITPIGSYKIVFIPLMGPKMQKKKKKPHKKQRTKKHLAKRIGLVLGIKNERYKRLNEMIYRGCSYTWKDLILHVCMCTWKILRKYIHIYISNLFRCICGFILTIQKNSG